MRHSTNSTEGYTIIELLVSLSIMSLLAALAIPSFLNQSLKARESEAVLTLASVNQFQVMFFVENSRFASSVDSLGSGMPSTTANYSYSTTTSADNTTTTAAALKPDLKSATAGTALEQDRTITSVICKALQRGRRIGRVTVPPGLSRRPVCPSGTRVVR